MKRQAESAPETIEAQDARVASPRAPSPAGVGFEAVGSYQTFTPPDPIMAVRPLHVVAIVNSRYQVWDKSGHPLMDPVLVDQFFGGVPHCSGVFDVFVDYDEAENRFVMGGESVVAGAGTESYLCVAATATNDPTQVWHRTSFRSDSEVPLTWLDYPHMGIGLDAIYIAGNMFADGGGLDSAARATVKRAAKVPTGGSATPKENGGGKVYRRADIIKLQLNDPDGYEAMADEIEAAYREGRVR